MGPAALQPLARQLRLDGFLADTFGYPSLRGGPEAAVAKLRAHIESTAADGPVHVIGHSLGGLVALECARALAPESLGRIVCLGSPLRGSDSARSMSRHWGTGWLLGDSAELLQRGVGAWDGQCEVGVIAGRMPVGLGALFGSLTLPHDGTVCVAETELAGVTDHRVIPASHTGLLFSRAASDACIAFLRHGRFP